MLASELDEHWYILKQRVPADLRRHYRTGRIAYSLRTKSIRDARVRAMSDAAKLDRHWHIQSTHIGLSSCVDWQRSSIIAPTSLTFRAIGILRSYRIYDNHSGVVNSPVHLSTQSVAVMFPAYEQLPLCDIPAYLPQPATAS